jgi:hypothetical protein
VIERGHVVEEHGVEDIDEGPALDQKP